MARLKTKRRALHSQGRTPFSCSWLLTTLFVCLTLLASCTIAQQHQQQPFEVDPITQTPHNISNDTTPLQAYTQAIHLLRSTIEPSALSRYHQRQITEQQPQPQLQSQTHQPTSSSLRRSSSPQRRLQHKDSRTTLSDLSPYFTFLTSWGPIGTVMRLAARIRAWFALYNTKIRNFLSLGQTPLSMPFIRSPSRPAGPRASPEPVKTKVWPGEKPAALWPAWEVDAGQSALHGPFLFGHEEQSEPLASSQISHWLEKIASFTARSRADQDSAAAASARREDGLQWLSYAADPPAPHRPSADALWVLSQHYILGTHGKQPQPWRAFPYLSTLVERVDVGNASAHNLLGWLYSSNDLWTAWGANAGGQEQWQGESQSKSLLHHTFAAQQGDYPSQMALAYRSLVGISTPPDCPEAMRWYERAADQSYIRFKQGPVGGLPPPYTHVRLSDLAGGVYGPGASAASTGWAAHRPAIQAALNSLPSAASVFSPDASDPSRLSDLLEFYSYHAAGGSLLYTLRLAQIYYQGSIYGLSESAGRVRRNYAKSRELALRITRRVWPVEVANLKMSNGRRIIKSAFPPATRTPGEEPEEDIIVKGEAFVMMQGGAAAALLGNMYLRGEGVVEDWQKAWFWFWRGAEVGDRDCQYGFGLMRSLGMAPDQWRHKDGKLLKKGQSIDMKRAVDMWEKAVKGGGMAGHAPSSCAMGKVHLEMGDFTAAGHHFAACVSTGSAFDGFYTLGLVNAKVYQQSLSVLSPPGHNEQRCRAATTLLKHAAERGDWESPVFHWGLRAWELGDKKRAIVYWSMAAERGDEAAQNNLAYIMDRDRRRWKLPSLDDRDQDNSTDRLALMYWTRSAAQDNVDALVKLGDYYYHGIGVTPPSPPPSANVNGTTSSSSSSSSTLPRANYEKALACYATAADRQSSALAYWNMGHLYETGRGVPRRDFHLAKRYYDLALGINHEAYFPVMLSLVSLHVKALWATVWKREESAVALFSSYAASGAVGGYTEAEEEVLRSRSDGRDDDDEREEYFDEDDMGGDLNLPEAYDLRKQQQRKRQQQHHHQADRTTDGSDEGEQQQRHHQHSSSDDASASLSSLMSLSEEEADAMIDGAMIVIGLSALAMLVYARQAAQNRAEQERREEERRRGGEVPQQQPAAAQQGPRYAGGLPWPPDAAGAANQLAGL